MKKIISLVLVLLFVAAMTAGCKSESGELAGTYKISEFHGKSVLEYFGDQAESAGKTLEEYLAMYGATEETADEYLVLTLTSDGVAEMCSFGVPELPGTWLRDGNTLKVTFNRITQAFTIDGDDLIMDGSSMVFTKS